MSVSKFEIYMLIGRALKNGDEKLASEYAQIIVNHKKNNKAIFSHSEEIALSRAQKKLLNR